MGAIALRSEVSVTAPPPELAAAACNWNGTTGADDTAAIQALATAYPTATLVFPTGHPCYSATGLVFTTPVFLQGSGSLTPGISSTSQGASIVCAQAVVTCVKYTPVLQAPPIRDLNILGANTSPLSGSTCLRMELSYNVVLDRVRCSNFDNGFYFYSTASAGISVHASKLFTCNITGNYLVFDGWPEAYIDNSRFGCNSGPNPTANAYVKITGGNATNAAGGPNTLHFNNNHFNGAANYWLSFESQLPASIADIVEYNFYNNHVEGVHTAYIHSDSTWPVVQRVQLSANTLNSAQPLFSLDATTALKQWTITGNIIACTNITVAPPQIRRFDFVGNEVGCGGTITGPGASTIAAASFSGNTFSGNVTLDGAWGSLYWANSFAEGGTLTDSATGTKAVLRTNGPSTLTAPYSGGQLVLGSSGQSGLIQFARGADGLVRGSVGWAGASEANRFFTTVIGGSSVAGLNAADPTGTSQIQANSVTGLTVGVGYGNQAVIGTTEVAGRLDLARTGDGTWGRQWFGYCDPSGATDGALCVNSNGGSAEVRIQAQNTGGLVKIQVGTTPTTIGIWSDLGLNIVPVAVASLGTCNAGAEGTFRPVNNNNGAVFNAAVVAGGTDHIVAYCNGTGWVVH
jgi:hypothetical protein